MTGLSVEKYISQRIIQQGSFASLSRVGSLKKWSLLILRSRSISRSMTLACSRRHQARKKKRGEALTAGIDRARQYQMYQYQTISMYVVKY